MTVVSRKSKLLPALMWCILFIPGLEGCKGTSTMNDHGSGIGCRSGFTEAKTRSRVENHNTSYNNDLDRLTALTSRLNRASGSSFSTVFAIDDTQTGQEMIGIDYALFDRLSDNGAAVLIAESIARKLIFPLRSTTEQRGFKTTLEVDEMAGVYLARAGFSVSGFSEWLKVGEKTDNLNTIEVPRKRRTDAFLNGYSSAAAMAKRP